MNDQRVSKFVGITLSGENIQKKVRAVMRMINRVDEAARTASVVRTQGMSEQSGCVLFLLFVMPREHGGVWNAFLRSGFMKRWCFEESFFMFQ